MMTTRNRVRLLKAGVWLLCLVPVGRLAWRLLLGDRLGVNPIEEAEHWSGLSALVILLATLAVTPLRRLSGWNDLQKVRRLVGLFAFFYAFVHFGIYLGLDQFFGWSYILEDIAERPYITVGFTAFVLLIPLAVTSTKGWIRRLGRRWITLHRLAYASGVLGVLHYLWIQKADFRRPAIAGAVLVVLLGMRVWWAVRKRRGRLAEVRPLRS
ncbi:MAG TPA: protein-methionine-sulfoxide reductase heme-binding subunit MsrQ [Longimicrobiales bacterium]|jgi:sulfoxide reductase heme-binding subunit YedZ